MVGERPERVGRQVLQAAEDDDHADQQADEERTIGRESAGAGGKFWFRGERTGDREDRDHEGEAAEQHGGAEAEIE